MIELAPITEHNFRECVQMQVDPSQARFVASNVYSLAQAWLYADTARPYAIVHDGALVGFCMLIWDEPQKTCELWRLMIGRAHQGQGYGAAALEKIIALARACPAFETMSLSYVADNHVAKRLYLKHGLKPTGEMSGDEAIMRLDLRGGSSGAQ